MIKIIMCEIYETHRWNNPYHPLDRICLRCGIKKYQDPFSKYLRENRTEENRLRFIEDEKKAQEHWKNMSIFYKYGYLKSRWYHKFINIKYKCLKYFS